MLKKTCPACQTTFECHVDNIFQCQCYDVPLNAYQKEQIERQYNDCLCASCLNNINKQPLTKLPKQ